MPQTGLLLQANHNGLLKSDVFATIINLSIESHGNNEEIISLIIQLCNHKTYKKKHL